MIRVAILICLAALLLTGCQKKAGPAPTENKPAPTAPAAPPAAPPATPSGDPSGDHVDETSLDELDVKTTEEPETKLPEKDVPTPEDFEEEATRKVTASNVESELEAMEDELGNGGIAAAGRRGNSAIEDEAPVSTIKEQPRPAAVELMANGSLTAYSRLAASSARLLRSPFSRVTWAAMLCSLKRSTQKLRPLLVASM